MSRSLIINARHRLPWHKRFVSDASTAMAWGGWLWLWSPFVRSTQLLAHGSADNLERSVLALLGTSGTLLVWNRLPARKARAAKPMTVREYARHFDLPERELEAGRNASVCVVRHDDHGRIVAVESRSAAERAPLAMAG